MYRECKECKNRMMIIEEKFPKYTRGMVTIYGCPTCGRMEMEYDDSNVKDNPIKIDYSCNDVNKYYVSN